MYRAHLLDSSAEDRPWYALPLHLLIEPHLPRHHSRAAGSGAPLAHCSIAGGSGQRGYFTTLPQCEGQWAGVILHYTTALQGAVSSGAPSVSSLNAGGQWAVQLLLYTTTLQGSAGSGASSIHCRTAGDNGQWGFFSTLLHDTGQCSCSTLPAVHRRTARGSGQGVSFSTLPHCRGHGAVGGVVWCSVVWCGVVWWGGVRCTKVGCTKVVWYSRR